MTEAQVCSQGAASQPFVGISRADEDYLDWVENHERAVRTSRRLSAALVGIAFTLTAATVATIAFVGL